jgi:hypothetical protein
MYNETRGLVNKAVMCFRMTINKLIMMVISALLCSCTTIKLATNDVAALYSTVNAKGMIIPITYSYGVVRSIDNRIVPFDENPIFVKAGRHEIEIKYGRCFAPVLIIACDAQPAKVITIAYEFVGGKKYRLTPMGTIVEL